MRSIAEIDADIAEVQKRIAARNEGNPQRNSPEYRAARFDYIVDGDRSGLDAYQNALNAAIQNKLNRESAEYMAELNRGEAALEKDDEIVKHISDTDAVIDDLKKRNYSDDSVEMKKAKNEQDYWLRRADRRGLNVSLYRDTPKDATVASKTPAPAQNNAAPKARPYEQIAEDIARLDNDKEATLERVNELEGELDSVADSVPYGKVTESKNHLNSKKAELATARWNEYNSRVKAALGEKNYGKRKAALEPLKEELANYKGQEKYAEVEKSINDGLKKPVASPVVGYIKNLKAKDLMSSYTTLRKAKNKTVTENAPIGENSYPYKVTYNNDNSLTVSGGGYSRTFNASDFSEESLGNEKKPESTNSVAAVLSGGDSGKKANRGSASRKARVAEPED